MKNIMYLKTDELIPYENNPRNNDDAVEPVMNSIKEFGFKQPIIIDKDKVIIAGHTRLRAAKRLGLDEVPCIMADDLTDEQVKAFRLADNKVAEFADWNFELLDEELDSLSDFDMEEFGFDMEEIRVDFNLDKEYFEVEETECHLELPAEPKSRLGDIYQLGRHRLMCGDSTSLNNVESLMNGNKADMLLTDPPYNVDYEGKTKEKLKLKNDKMSNDKFRQFLVDAFANANIVLKNGGVFYIWHAESEGYNFRGACDDVGWKVRQCLIWKKNSFVLGRQDYQWKHEPCLYGWKEGAAHLWESDRKQTTVIDYEKPSRNDVHPTMKPVGLFDYQIKNNTKAGDVVLDLFGGSGTTIMACEQNGRTAYTMEFDPVYVDVIIDRWEKFTGQKAVLVNNQCN